jgi:hypothetical protein
MHIFTNVLRETKTTFNVLAEIDDAATRTANNQRARPLRASRTYVQGVAVLAAGRRSKMNPDQLLGRGSNKDPLMELLGRYSKWTYWIDRTGSLQRLVSREPSVPVRHRRVRKLSIEKVDVLVELYRSGATMIELAEEFKVHRTTVSAHLRRAGEKPGCVVGRARSTPYDGSTLRLRLRARRGGGPQVRQSRSLQPVPELPPVLRAECETETQVNPTSLQPGLPAHDRTATRPVFDKS